MKKLFTSILMIGVALTGWASVSSSYDEGTKTLTITYVADANNPNEITNLNVGDLIQSDYRSAEKLVFVGDWANAHLSKIGSCVDYCCSNV